MPTGILLDDFFKRHDTGYGHPENARRLDAIEQGIAHLLPGLVRIPARPATLDEIAAVHAPAYIETARKDILYGHGELTTGDTVVSHDSWDAALLAAGGAIAMVEAVVTDRVANGFCAVRPPGHHATPTIGMGFCIFNNIAIAARAAQRRFGAKRILIIDWDVHHGNGTQDAFYDDGTVLFFSSHQHPLYPGTGMADEIGVGPGEGFTLNVPVKAGGGYTEIAAGLERLKALMADKNFVPDLILISAGFDSRLHDPLGHLTVTDDEFAKLTRTLKRWAAEYCNGRVVSILEGGYNLRTLGGAVAAHITALME